jgi:segregation and condensation protein B
MTRAELIANLEAVLFVAADPVHISSLVRATGARTREVEAALGQLERELAGRGIRLIRAQQQVTLSTAPEAAVVVERFIGTNMRTQLSAAALETLAIIAYMGPVTKSQVEEVRGVSAEATIKHLLGRGLIEAKGASTTPGRPTLYKITPGFLQAFGLAKVSDLPQLKQFGAQDQPDAAH